MLYTSSLKHKLITKQLIQAVASVCENTIVVGHLVGPVSPLLLLM